MELALQHLYPTHLRVPSPSKLFVPYTANEHNARLNKCHSTRSNKYLNTLSTTFMLYQVSPFCCYTECLHAKFHCVDYCGVLSTTWYRYCNALYRCNLYFGVLLVGVFVTVCHLHSRLILAVVEMAVSYRVTKVKNYSGKEFCSTGPML